MIVLPVVRLQEVEVMPHQPSTADPCPQESPVVRLTSVVQLQQVQVMPYFPLLQDPCQEECPVVIVLLVQ